MNAAQNFSCIHQLDTRWGRFDKAGYQPETNSKKVVKIYIGWNLTELKIK